LRLCAGRRLPEEVAFRFLFAIISN
jgi:hypothetical protein